ncbi:Uncharacterised protein [uncultured archaeon]|nr:Uncharacterised protein [uncultured archaeon]
MKTEKAIQKKIKIGEKTSEKLLDYLKKNPDKTVYDLSKDLNWSTGKVQKALYRIKRDIGFEQYIESGRLKKKYYATLKILT